MTKATRSSRFLSLVLRHQPETIGITLDPQGWAKVADVVKGMKAAGHDVSRQTLAEIVRTDEKGRFAVSPDGLRIRANQGHSIMVDLGLEALPPPEWLYHGTTAEPLSAIRKDGLLKRNRQYVHLSGDVATAVKVGKRRGKPVVLPIHAANLHRAGHAFYLSANGVWLTDRVPPDFIDWAHIHYDAT